MDLWQIVGQTLLAVVAVIVLARLNGLRSFSKMASFDFALTIATGSILATIMTSSKTPWPGLVALITLFATRFAVSLVRKRWQPMKWLTDNTALMLFYEGQLFRENLALARVTEDEVRGKMREANALEPSRVRAIVLEATGDVSVLHGDRLDPGLLKGVSWGKVDPPKGWDRPDGALQ